mmetsp:Transcript_32064/g.44720  ORF Transcript_32064/g.44720 Transcript_32064/m.44720 type:complete len:208 (-) Transcript_32064:63-686(-)
MNDNILITRCISNQGLGVLSKLPFQLTFLVLYLQKMPSRASLALRSLITNHALGGGSSSKSRSSRGSSSSSRHHIFTTCLHHLASSVDKIKNVTRVIFSPILLLLLEHVRTPSFHILLVVTNLISVEFCMVESVVQRPSRNDEFGDHRMNQTCFFSLPFFPSQWLPSLVSVLSKDLHSKTTSVRLPSSEILHFCIQKAALDAPLKCV